MKPFDGIPEFIAVAEAEGFSAAARKLGVSTSKVSRQVSALERRLDVQLVARTTRRVRLTDAGLAYYRRCADAIQSLDEASHALSGEMAELEGHLRISVIGHFARHFVVPVLADLARENPKLSMELDFSARIVDFIKEGIDFALRNGPMADSDLVARRLVDRTMAAAASPDYFAKFGHPADPDDLRQHRCLVGPFGRWRFYWPKGPRDIRVTGQWRSNSAQANIEACKRGLGIAYLPRTSYGSAFRDGSLAPTLEQYWDKGLTTWIVYPSRRYLPTRTTRAIDYLLERFSDWSEA